MSSGPRILTTVVGSYPGPDRLLTLPSGQALTDVTRVVIHTREKAGIDVVCDGEPYRFNVNHPETNGMIEYFVRPIAEVRTAVTFDEANLPGHPDEWEWAARAINKVLDAVKGKDAVHLCFGNYGGQSIQKWSWDKLIQYLNSLHVDHIVMENAHRLVEALAAFRDLRPEIGMGLGVVDIKATQAESPDQIAQAIERVERRPARAACATSIPTAASGRSSATSPTRRSARSPSAAISTKAARRAERRRPPPTLRTVLGLPRRVARDSPCPGPPASTAGTPGTGPGHLGQEAPARAPDDRLPQPVGRENHTGKSVVSVFQPFRPHQPFGPFRLFRRCGGRSVPRQRQSANGTATCRDAGTMGQWDNGPAGGTATGPDKMPAKPVT